MSSLINASLLFCGCAQPLLIISESPPMKRGLSQKCLVTESADASFVFLYAIVNIVFRWSESPPRKRGKSAACRVTESARGRALYYNLFDSESSHLTEIPTKKRLPPKRQPYIKSKSFTPPTNPRCGLREQCREMKIHPSDNGSIRPAQSSLHCRS